MSQVPKDLVLPHHNGSNNKIIRNIFHHKEGVFMCDMFYIIKISLYGLVVRVPGYKSSGTVSIPGPTTFSEK
jgi:hypothetical protein